MQKVLDSESRALNCSAVPTVATIFRGDDKFYWIPTGSKFRWQTYSTGSILQHYGYSINKKDSKKPHSLIAINLVSPKLDYTSYGKSRIDFRPFAGVIAETTMKACMGAVMTTIIIIIFIIIFIQCQ